MLNLRRVLWLSVMCLLVHGQVNITWFIPAEETQRLNLPGPGKTF